MDKEKKIKDWFVKYPKVLVALSGGVDSCLVAFFARKYLGKENAVSIIGVSPSLKKKDLAIAEEFCNEHDITLVKLYPKEMDDPNYNTNPINRCYFCKTALYDEMHELRVQEYPDFVLVNGNNKTDWKDYRPGLKAADEKSAFSPLADCGFEKEDIRNYAEKFGLKVWDKPASPCLSSRFPYGENITKEKLAMVEKAENILNDFGFNDVRVRYDNGRARIEVLYEEISRLLDNYDKIESMILNFGFEKCEIDSEGLVSGKLNRALDI